jgi:putative holliday junction resolvase
LSRVIGLDPGTKRVGVAVSNSDRSLAFPRPSLRADDNVSALVAELVRDEGATLVVVGRPVALSGRETASTQLADQFRQLLTDTLVDVDVVAVDERLTTTSAQQRLSSAGVSHKNQRDIIDSAAAVVLLQTFLDATPH